MMMYELAKFGCYFTLRGSLVVNCLFCFLYYNCAFIGKKRGFKKKKKKD